MVCGDLGQFGEQGIDFLALALGQLRPGPALRGPARQPVGLALLAEIGFQEDLPLDTTGHHDARQPAVDADDPAVEVAHGGDQFGAQVERQRKLADQHGGCGGVGLDRLDPLQRLDHGDRHLGGGNRRRHAGDVAVVGIHQRLVDLFHDVVGMRRRFRLGTHAGEPIADRSHEPSATDSSTQALKALHEAGACKRARRNHVVDGGASRFHTLRQHHFLLARQQRMLRHVPQVEADRIGRVLGKSDVATSTSGLCTRRSGAVGVGDGARRDFKGGHYDCPRITNSIRRPQPRRRKNNSHATETNVAAPPTICGPVYVTKFRHSYFR